MRQIDWKQHKAHREQVVEDRGQWLGLLDEDFIPIGGLDLPPLTDMDWPQTRGEIDSVEMTLPVRTPAGRLHPVVSELVAENLGRVDAVGKLVPVTGPARLIRRERAGGRPLSMRVTHTVASGDARSPHTLAIYGISLLGYLDLLPCPSNPVTWVNKFTRFTRDWVGPTNVAETFDQPRDLAEMTMITVADGATVSGDSDVVIHRLIRDSVQAAHRVAGRASDPVYAVVLEERRAPARPMMLRPTDQTIWQEVAEDAMNAGVSIRADLWWPGDPMPRGLALTLPTIVFTVRQEY